MDERHISFKVNGEAYALTVATNRTLLSLLRDTLKLTGTKYGCGEGECGACTVLMDGRPVNACLVLAVKADKSEILTVEGLADGGKLHPLQTAFIEKGALQCGYCTPGMLMSAYALLQGNHRPNDAEIADALAGNLCRCTGYQKIYDAVKEAAKVLYTEDGND
ncbi:MAG: (2Fe-2S)-binding protein [Christensenellaceae bacterium]|jgi:carbon-monoxide dehydrogenase small subunit|nr:(2Fe-2S)-binding protein [Christensenellaceae bacterium]